MRKRFLAFFSVLLCFAHPLFAEPVKQPAEKVVLLIAEQNIEGPQHAWWASEIDLSATEAAVASLLISKGYEVVDPSALKKVISQKPAFRAVDIGQTQSLELGNASSASYVVLGKAIASSGGSVPQSSMKSCFANVTAKLLRVKDGKVVAYLNASGNSAHMDPITGGREALTRAGEDMANKIAAALAADGGK